MASEGYVNGGNISLDIWLSCSKTMKFISIVTGMVASIIALIIDVLFCQYILAIAFQNIEFVSEI